MLLEVQKKKAVDNADDAKLIQLVDQGKRTQVEFNYDARITVTNLLLKCKAGNWLVDGIHIRNVAQVMHPFFVFKLRARLRLAHRCVWRKLSFREVHISSLAKQKLMK